MHLRQQGGWGCGEVGGDDCVGVPLCQEREAYSKYRAHGGEGKNGKEGGISKWEKRDVG